MFKILEKRYLSPKVALLRVEAPRIAKARRAGHFVIVRATDHSERIPLTIAQADLSEGTITLVIQGVGDSSNRLVSLNEGDCIHDIVGPLGRPTEIAKVGTVLCAGGGVGIAPLLPIVEAFHAAGNRVITVLAGRTKELVIFQDEMKEASDEVIIITDDGSLGEKGLITDGIKKVLEREHVDRCVTVGPAIMMKFVSQLTKEYNIPTIASLNAIMVDELPTPCTTNVMVKCVSCVLMGRNLMPIR